MTGKELAEWMDANEISIEMAARLFGTTENTIYKWRSTRGIAEKKQAWVGEMVAKYNNDKGVTYTPEPHRISIPMTDEQFETWSEAALESGETLMEWAKSALESAADTEIFNRSATILNETGIDYTAKKQDKK